MRFFLGGAGQIGVITAVVLTDIYHSCVSVWFLGTDRTTTIGQLISAYLEKKSDLEDHTVHLLFSANRWELV